MATNLWPYAFIIGVTCIHTHNIHIHINIYTRALSIIIFYSYKVLIEPRGLYLQINWVPEFLGRRTFMTDFALSPHNSPFPVDPLPTICQIICQTICQTQYSVVKYKTYTVIISKKNSRYGTIAEGLTTIWQIIRQIVASGSTAFLSTSCREQNG